MQLLGRLEIKSQQKIIEFLNKEQTGRICSIDEKGYPQIIPMNFVWTNNSIYVHSHIKRVVCRAIINGYYFQIFITLRQN